MQFVTVRQLRSQSAQVWKRLATEPDIIITSNGSPIAILSAVSAGGLEESLAALRRARAVAAIETMQRQSVSAGKVRMPPRSIQREIDAHRKGRRK